MGVSEDTKKVGMAGAEFSNTSASDDITTTSNIWEKTISASIRNSSNSDARPSTTLH
ncbi:hypothetical protein GCM10007169_20080 [Shewanella fodinae]|nr:hypothetical protein GCM10007169_20080 [Shewanella fodinae]